MLDDAIHNPMDLDRALAISFIFHLTVAGLMFLSWSPKPEVRSYSTVELIQLKAANQKPRRERVKGSQNKTPVEKKQNELSAQKQESKEGTDQEDAAAIEGGNTNDPRLVAVANYAQELQHYIEKNRYYPRRAMMMEQTGTVKVQLTINPDGSFARVEILQKSDYDILNQAAHELVIQLKSFKPLPQSYRGNGTFIVPINYQLRDQSI